ncbi:diaminopimelate epimerase [Geodermatophilus sp. SYSU D00965]
MDLPDLHGHTFAMEYDELRRRGTPGIDVPGVDVERLTFSIMHGNGNVILVVDEAFSSLPPAAVCSDLARGLCGSFRSVRVDGVAFVRTTGDRVRMTYFERDGTHSQMCGNALRCVTRYGADRGYLRADSDVVDTDDGPKWVSAAQGRIRVALGHGREFQQVAEDRYFVFSGLPHLVLLLDESDDLDAVDVRTTGAALRYDEELCRDLGHPEGLHVDFMARDGDGIRIRTYEVGVEDETLACGTGVGASAYVAHRVWALPYPLRVGVPGGEMRVEESEHGLLISGTTGSLFTSAPALTDA